MYQLLVCRGLAWIHDAKADDGFYGAPQTNTPAGDRRQRFRFVKVTPRNFFGYQPYDVYGRSVAISTPEKTLLDCIYRADLVGGPAELARIIYCGLAEVDTPALHTAANAKISTARLQRLGYLADLAGWPFVEDAFQFLKLAIPKSYRSHFGRSEPQDGGRGYVAVWGLMVNAQESDLLADVKRVLSRESH